MAKKTRFNTTSDPVRQIKMKAWRNYTDTLKTISDKASDELRKYIVAGHEEAETLDYAYALVTKYGEASAEMACQMYEALAEYSGASVAAAEPAETATYGETARAIRGEQLRTQDASVISKTAGRLVKLASVDTMMKNALRDGAEWAWIPSGDTCAFCLMLASNGWQRASEKAIKNGHAEHIHNNCDCTYAVRFSKNVDVEGYDPETMYEEYINAGDTQWERINALRRKHYAANREKINAQKRAAYTRRNTNSVRMKTETAWKGEPRQNTEKVLLELNQYALDKGVVLDPIFMSFDGDIDLVKDFIGTVNDIINNRQFIRKKKIKLSVSYTMMDDTYAETNGSKITINGFAYRDRALLEKSYALKVEECWFPQGSTYLDIATHESAHVIVYMDQLKTKDVSIAVFGNDEVKAANEILDHVSEYALYNNNELIAESYVAYRNGSKDEYVLNVLKYTGIIS